ncbi:MAG: SpoIIE family protein phosphatase [Verrucomicrobiota bacterium]
MRIPLRVLIVEDSEFDAKILVNVLRKGGYEPAHERVETLEALRKALETGNWQVVLADYNLPAFTAMEALKTVQEFKLDMPFIIISGGIGEDVAAAAMKAGAHDYFMKGNLTRLVAAVERELRESSVRNAQRQAEDALRESELRYRLLWETATDAVLLMDTDSRIHFANPAVEKIFGYQPDELIGQNLTLLLPERIRTDSQDGFAKLLRSGVKESHRHVIETVGSRKDSREVLIEIAFNDMALHGKRWFVAFIRDITERIRAERELSENQEQFRVAREIQQRLFPKASPSMPDFDIAGLSHPAEATGGDYFDYLSMLHNRLGVVVGDVTGHGVGPALLMAETRAYLRVLARNRDDVGEILSRANRVLAEDVGYERFVTLILAQIDPNTHSLVYSSAGHPSCYVLDPTGAVRVELKRTGIPLGIKPDTTYKSSSPVLLAPGELILMLTDGIEEAVSPGGDLFGTERILDVVRANREKSAQEIVETLYQAMRDFSAGAPQLDDFTAIIIKVID